MRMQRHGSQRKKPWPTNGTKFPNANLKNVESLIMIKNFTLNLALTLTTAFTTILFLYEEITAFSNKNWSLTNGFVQ